MKQHNTFLWVAAVVLAMGALLAWAIPAFTGTSLSPVAPRRVQFVLAPPHPTVRGQSPSIYKATPHSILVLIPDDIDRRIVHRPDTSGLQTPIYQPPGHLEKR